MAWEHKCLILNKNYASCMFFSEISVHLKWAKTTFNRKCCGRQKKKCYFFLVPLQESLSPLQLEWGLLPESSRPVFSVAISRRGGLWGQFGRRLVFLAGNQVSMGLQTSLGRVHKGNSNSDVSLQSMGSPVMLSSTMGYGQERLTRDSTMWLELSTSKTVGWNT